MDERERNLKLDSLAKETERIRSADAQCDSSVNGDYGTRSFAAGASANCGTVPAPYSGGLTLENVEHAFRYQRWHAYQQDQGEQVRDALVAAAKIILRLVPPSPSRTRALNNLMDARMLANQAITFGGQF